MSPSTRTIGRSPGRPEGRPGGATVAAVSSRQPALGVATSRRPRSQRADPSVCSPRGRLRGRSLEGAPGVSGGSGGKTPSPRQQSQRAWREHAPRPDAVVSRPPPVSPPTRSLHCHREHVSRRARMEVHEDTRFDAGGEASLAPRSRIQRAAQRSPPGRSQAGRATAPRPTDTPRGERPPTRRTHKGTSGSPPRPGRTPAGVTKRHLVGYRQVRLLCRPPILWTSRSRVIAIRIRSLSPASDHTDGGRLPWGFGPYDACRSRQRPTPGLPDPAVLRLQVFSTS
jgi:hypothetical protein